MFDEESYSNLGHTSESLWMDRLLCLVDRFMFIYRLEVSRHNRQRQQEGAVADNTFY